MDEKDLIAAVAPPTDSKPAEEDPLAEQKAAFDALLKQQEDGNDGGKSATKAAKDAVAEAKAKKAPKAEKAAKPAEGEAEAPQKAKEDPKQKSETERLRAKLLLSGAPKAAIESLTDDDVREWWSNQEQREADRARALERASAAEKKLAASQTKATSQSEPDQDGVPTEELDLAEIARDLADQFGEDESGVILKALKHLTDPLKEQVRGLQDILDKARTHGMENLSKTNRQRLAEKLPLIGESDKAWTKLRGLVEAEMGKEDSGWSTIEEAYDSIFDDLYGPMVEALAEKASQPEPEEPDDSEDEKSRIAASSVTPPTPKKRDKKPTHMEAAYSAWRVLQKDSEDVDGARRAFKRAGDLVQ